jgi:histidinol-phosphatase (PHP family)
VDQAAGPLPADSHVHTEWSWDARDGSMQRTWARAVELGLPAVAFTEHVDHTPWAVGPGDIGRDEFLLSLMVDGRLTPPAFDAAGYLTAIEECRQRFPTLRIHSGMEIGEPHWHADVGTWPRWRR